MPVCMSNLDVHAPYSCHIRHGHATCTCCLSLLLLQFYAYVAFPCYILVVHVAFPFCMSMRHAHNSCPCFMSCVMSMFPCCLPKLRKCESLVGIIANKFQHFFVHTSAIATYICSVFELRTTVAEAQLCTCCFEITAKKKKNDYQTFRLGESKTTSVHDFPLKKTISKPDVAVRGGTRDAIGLA
jgi:hypothetical protein